MTIRGGLDTRGRDGGLQNRYCVKSVVDFRHYLARAFLCLSGKLPTAPIHPEISRPPQLQRPLDTSSSNCFASDGCTLLTKAKRCAFNNLGLDTDSGSVRILCIASSDFQS